MIEECQSLEIDWSICFTSYGCYSNKNEMSLEEVGVAQSHSISERDSVTVCTTSSHTEDTEKYYVNYVKLRKEQST